MTVETAGLTGFSERDVPWAGLDAVIDPPVYTAKEAMHIGGLDFRISLMEAGWRNPEGSYESVEFRRAVVREDTGEFFEFVSDLYPGLQNYEIFPFLDEIRPTYVGAGTYGGGRQTFVVIHPSENSVILPKIRGIVDPHDLYVVVRSSHDRTRGVECSLLTVRQQSMGSVSLPCFTSRVPHRWSIRSLDPKSSIARLEAHRLKDRAKRYAEEFKTQAEQLASIKLTVPDGKQILETVLPLKPMRPRQIKVITESWQSSPKGYSDSGWGLLQSLIEFFSFGRADGLRTDWSVFTDGLTGPTFLHSSALAKLLINGN